MGGKKREEDREDPKKVPEVINKTWPLLGGILVNSLSASPAPSTLPFSRPPSCWCVVHLWRLGGSLKTKLPPTQSGVSVR